MVKKRVFLLLAALLLISFALLAWVGGSFAYLAEIFTRQLSIQSSLFQGKNFFDFAIKLWERLLFTDAFMVNNEKISGFAYMFQPSRISVLGDTYWIVGNVGRLIAVLFLCLFLILEAVLNKMGKAFVAPFIGLLLFDLIFAAEAVFTLFSGFVKTTDDFLVVACDWLIATLLTLADVATILLFLFRNKLAKRRGMVRRLFLLPCLLAGAAGLVYLVGMGVLLIGYSPFGSYAFSEVTVLAYLCVFVAYLLIGFTLLKPNTEAGEEPAKEVVGTGSGKKKKIAPILLSFITGALLLSFGVYFFLAFPHALPRINKIILAPPMGDYDLATGKAVFSLEWLKYFFSEFLPRYCKEVFGNLFTLDERYESYGKYGMPLCDIQIVKFLRIFCLCLLAVFVIVKAFRPQTSKVLFAVPFGFLILCDLVFGGWTTIVSVVCVFGEFFGLDSGIFNWQYIETGHFTSTMYNVAMHLICGFGTYWAFFMIDAVALALTLFGKKLEKIKVVGKYFYLLPGALATLTVLFYIGCNVWNMQTVVGMELFSLILFAAACYPLGWLLTRKGNEESNAAEIT